MPQTGREYPNRPLVGIGAVIIGSRGVVLIKRGKPPRVGSWSLPGGAQKVGETVNDAAQREILEETNLVSEIRGLVDVVDSIHHDADGKIQYHYTLVDVLATVDHNATPVAGGDAADAKWISIDQIPKLELWSETVRIIEKAHSMWRNL